MAVAALALPRLQLFDANGDPLAGGRLYSYHGGTTTPLATYNSAAGTSPNANPAIADAGGFLDVWLTCATAYKISIHAANDTALSTIDNITLPIPSNEPTDLDGLSDTVTEGNSTLDPGEPGSEVLAQTLAGELQQLRFVDAELKGNQNWRQSREILSAHNGVIDPGEPGLEVMALFGNEQIQQLRWVITELKGNVSWGQTTESITGHAATSDPGEPATPILANFGEPQIRQLRFVLSQMKNGQPWNQAYKTRLLPISWVTQGAANVTWTPTGTTVWNFYFYVPEGWQTNSNFIFSFFRRANTTGTGTAQMTFQFSRVRDGQPVNPSGAGDIDFTPGDTNAHSSSFLFAGTNFQFGDVGQLIVTRFGDDAGDTMTDIIIMDGAFLQYTGLAGV